LLLVPCSLILTPISSALIAFISGVWQCKIDGAA
jgi:hypothetical protein